MPTNTETRLATKINSAVALYSFGYEEMAHTKVEESLALAFHLGCRVRVLNNMANALLDLECGENPIFALKDALDYL